MKDVQCSICGTAIPRGGKVVLEKNGFRHGDTKFCELMLKGGKTAQERVDAPTQQPLFTKVEDKPTPTRKAGRRVEQVAPLIKGDQLQQCRQYLKGLLFDLNEKAEIIIAHQLNEILTREHPDLPADEVTHTLESVSGFFSIMKTEEDLPLTLSDLEKIAEQSFPTTLAFINGVPHQVKAKLVLSEE